jgi:predicted ATP-dependent serine protease
LLSEEGVGPAVGERLSRLGIHRRDVWLVGSATVDGLVDVLASKRAQHVVLDSIQESFMSAGDIRHVMQVAGLRSAWVISQLNRAGSPSGRRSLEHECDLLLRVEGGRWTCEKTRFQPLESVEGGAI